MEITRLSGFEQRNPVLLREAEALLTRDLGDLVGKSDRERGAKFHTLGSFYSSALKKQVYGGLKIVAGGEDFKEIEGYFLSSLCSLLAMEQFFPEVISQTPLFMGGVIDGNGMYLAMLMEDYSQGNQRRIWDGGNSHLIPKEMRKELYGDDDQLQGIYVSVNKEGMHVGEETIARILDLDRIPWLSNSRVLEHAATLNVEFQQDPNKLKPYLVQAPAQRHF